MQSYSREAAAKQAQHEIERTRIDRIKAVRKKEKQIAKQQRLQYSALHQLTQQQIHNEMEQKWERNKENELHKLTNHYNRLQSNIGSAHTLAHQNTNNLNELAIQSRKKVKQQNIISQRRARNAHSKLQQKILNEQTEKEKRVQWRNNAIKMAQIHRQKLQKQLDYQCFNLPPGLAPHNPSQNTTQYTLITEKECLDTFNPHPKIFIKQIKNKSMEKSYKLGKFLPKKLLNKLNKKYSAKRKKQKHRKKKEQKFKARGIVLKSDGNTMLSIPENNTLTENTMFHNIPSHIQRNNVEQKQQIVGILNNNNKNPWNEALKIRKKTAENQIKQTQQFMTAQKRGQIALQKEIQKTKSKELESELKVLHQQMIQQKLQKCQDILSRSGDTKQLQTELEQKFEKVFQIHLPSPHTKSITDNTNEEISPRVHAPKPQSFAVNNVCEKPQFKSHQKPVKKPKPTLVQQIPTVVIPSVKSHQNDDQKDTEESDTESDTYDSEEQSIESNVRMRRVKIHKNSDGSTQSTSQSTSLSTSVSTSPQKSMPENDRVIVPKKWFESLLRQVQNESDLKMNENGSEIKHITNNNGNEQIAMNRTWFQNLLNDIYSNKNESESDTETDMKMEINALNIQTQTEQIQQSINNTQCTNATLSRKTATNSPINSVNNSVNNNVNKSIQSLSANVNANGNEQSDENGIGNDEFNLIFKRKKPISILSEMLSISDEDMNDADDESDMSFNTSDINIEKTNKFIRESAALLNKTGNFFENFSESSMDYTKTDRRDMDLLRSSIQSIHSDTSSQWSLSSLSSIDFHKIPDSLHKLDQFLSQNTNETSNANTNNLQTIKESSDTVSSFTIESNKSRQPNTPKLFENTEESNLDYHSEEEKHSSMLSSQKSKKPCLPKQPLQIVDLETPPTFTKNSTNSKTRTVSTTNKYSTPCVTDGTINSYPSLPPSNRALDTKRTNNNNDSLLPIKHLNFLDIKVSENDNKNMSADLAVTELTNLNKEMDTTLQQVLKMKIDSNLKTETEKSKKNIILESINISEITPSTVTETDDSNNANNNSSNHSISNVMAKLSNLSTSTFSLSTFCDDFLQESGKTNDNLLERNPSSDSTSVDSQTKFPPLTPQDLEGMTENNIGTHSHSNNSYSFANDDSNKTSLNENSALYMRDLDIVFEEPPIILNKNETQNIQKSLQTLKAKKAK